MLRSSVDVLKEGLVIFFFFSSVYCSLWFLQNGKRVWLFWTVAFAIVGALFRMIILEILVVLGLWLGYGALRGRLQERRLACRYLGVVAPILGGILVFLIAVIWDWEFLTTKKVYGLIRNFFIQWFGYQKPNLFWVGAQCLHIIVRFIEKAYPLPFLLALFGLGGRVRAKEFGAEEKYLAILIAVLIIVFFLLLDASGRWLLLTIFLSYLWAGLGFITLRELIDRRFTRYPRLNAVVIVIILLGTILPISLQPQRLDKIGRKEVGLWLQERSLSSPVILTNIPRVVYYARGEYVSIPPQATPEEIVRKGAKESIDYLVIEEKESGLSESFIPFEKKGELELVLRHPYGRKGRTIYVYKMKKQIGPS
jgi:hypothetical protein